MDGVELSELTDFYGWYRMNLLNQQTVVSSEQSGEHISLCCWSGEPIHAQVQRCALSCRKGLIKNLCLINTTHTWNVSSLLLA